MKKKIILLAIVIATTFGCTKNISHAPVNSKTNYLIVSNAQGDSIPPPKKKGVCEGCSHQ